MEPTLTVYGAPWCPHCKRVKRFLAAHRVRYAFVDIDTDPDAIGRLKELQDGGQIIPTVIYADGTHEVNPSDETLARRIGLVAGVFAAGDVRSGSTKQLGSAVGDGIAALLMTRRYLEAHHHKAVALADAP